MLLPRLRYAVCALGVMFAAPAFAECNPVIDGFEYCANEGKTARPITRSSSSSTGTSRYAPMQSIGHDLSISPDIPATFGAITFGGGQRCAAGLFRDTCS